MWCRIWLDSPVARVNKKRDRPSLTSPASKSLNATKSYDPFSFILLLLLPSLLLLLFPTPTFGPHEWFKNLAGKSIKMFLSQSICMECEQLLLFVVLVLLLCSAMEEMTIDPLVNERDVKTPHWLGFTFLMCILPEHLNFWASVVVLCAF